MTRAAIYTRISQDATGKKAGVTRQLKDSIALANRLGVEVVAYFDDNDMSAYNSKTRPGFEAMLTALGLCHCAHPEINPLTYGVAVSRGGDDSVAVS